MFPKVTTLRFATAVGDIDVTVFAVHLNSPDYKEHISSLLNDTSHVITRGIHIYENKAGFMNDEELRASLKNSFSTYIEPLLYAYRLSNYSVDCSELNNPPDRLNNLPVVSIVLKRTNSLGAIHVVFEPLGLEE